MGNVIKMTDIEEREANVPSGLNHLVDGYIDYAKEVVVGRAIPAIDGLKPSQRRILYTMKFIEKVKDLGKSANIAGATMKLHPHGDSAIYETMVRMVHSSLYYNIPYLHGKGSFGKVFSSDAKPAAARYTEVMLEEVAEEFFRGMDGIQMVPSYNNKLEEPLLLPVSYPSILCNPTTGIAVGLATEIPSFNFHEVIKATIELIKKGKIKNPLMPDFTTGGYYVKNKVEEESLMEKGAATMKLRGVWHIENKTIVIDEIPYYTTLEKIMKKIDKIDEVVDIKDETDRKGLRLTIECSKKKIVDDVVKEILRISPLQMDVNANITIIDNGEPKEKIGVTELLKSWVKFREEVIETQLNRTLKSLIFEIEKYDILVDLMTTLKKRDEFMQVLLHKGRDKAKDLLHKFYPKANPEIFEWILNKTIGSLSNIGNKQRNHLMDLKQQKREIEEKLLDIKGEIVKELKELDKKYDFPRKTKITDEEFDLKKNAIHQEEKEPEEVLVVIDGLFIKKMEKGRKNNKIADTIECMSSDTFVFVNDAGNLLRVQVDHLDFEDERSKGTYIPNYISKDKNNFKIIDFDIVRDYKKGYLHKNGYVTTLDLSEWMDLARITTFTKNGLAAKYIDNIIGTFKQEMDFIVLRTKKDRLAIVSTDSYSEKSRRARSRLINLGKGDVIIDMCSANEEDLSKLVGDRERFEGHFRVINKEDGFNEKEFKKLQEKHNKLF